MSVQVRLIQGPLPPMTKPAYTPGSGAWIAFDGIVRPTEDGQDIQGLQYEAYQPMAQQQLKAIGQELLKKYALLSMDIEHSTGLVPNFACSFRLIIESRHRKEGLKAMDEFIDRLKQDVPIWKRTK